MVQDQGIDVYLAPFSDINKRYPEYAVPAGSPAHTNDPNEVYIEAVDGERFVIVVDLLEYFDTHQSSHLLMDYNRDGDTSRAHNTYQHLQRNAPEGWRLKGRRWCTSETRKINGRWVECGFMFAPLEMDEELEMDTDEIDRSANLHAKIVVELRRGDRIRTSVGRWQQQLWNGFDMPNTLVSSKAVVKDKHVSHAIRHMVLGDAQQPTYESAEDYRWLGVHGPGGDRIRFTIRYRSRDALQRLKIVPKDKMRIDLTLSPSPPPSPSPRIKREDRSGKNEKEAEGNGHAMVHACGGPGNDVPDQTSEADRSARTPMSTPAEAHTLTHQHDKKRKAMEDELKEVELEQKRLRLMRGLAKMDAGM